MAANAKGIAHVGIGQASESSDMDWRCSAGGRAPDRSWPGQARHRCPEGCECRSRGDPRAEEDLRKRGEMMATWTEEDIETLRTFYSLEGTAVNARFSTPHSPGSICQKALALGVSGPRRLRHKRHVDDSKRPSPRTRERHPVIKPVIKCAGKLRVMTGNPRARNLSAMSVASADAHPIEPARPRRVSHVPGSTRSIRSAVPVRERPRVLRRPPRPPEVLREQPRI